jgi:hypothetical protein
MYRANEKMFFKMLLSGRNIEIHIYCEDNMVYMWESYDKLTDKMEYSYLMSPATAQVYEDFKKQVQKELPLLIELV